MTRPDGDVWSRAMVRLDEVKMAIALIRQCLAQLPEGPVAVPGLPTVPAGEAVAKTEARVDLLSAYQRYGHAGAPEVACAELPELGCSAGDDAGQYGGRCGTDCEQHRPLYFVYQR
jgi:NADH:ubiquinone oxidoreductase subunit D